MIGCVLPLMAQWQSTKPFLSKVSLTAENFGAVPKTYIRTGLDKVTSPALQDTMIGNWSVDSILYLELGHFPPVLRAAETCEPAARTSFRRGLGIRAQCLTGARNEDGDQRERR